MGNIALAIPRDLGSIADAADKIHKYLCEENSRWPYPDCAPAIVFERNIWPERVIYNPPATIVLWNDGDKTVVICHEGDVYDEHEGFLLCCAKKLFGNTGRYNNVIREHVPDGDQFHRALKIICHPAGAPCEGEQR